MKKIKNNQLVIKSYFWFKGLLTLISPTLNTQIAYFISNRKFLNLKKPVTLDEKISYLKLYVYGQNLLVKVCADKCSIRDYVIKIGEPQILNELYGTYSTYDEIPWNALPNEFVLKWSSGSGMNYICKSKSNINHKCLRQTIKKWTKSKPYLTHSELQYKTNSATLLVEKYLGDSDGKLPFDYKVYCFNGKAKAIRVMMYREAELTGVFVSPSWDYISGISKFSSYEGLPEKPKNLKEIIRISEKLSNPFPFVRVDLYEVNGELILGEMTFTPTSGNKVIETDIEGKTMSSLLNINQEIIYPFDIG